MCPISPSFPVALLKNCIVFGISIPQGVGIRLTELFPEPVGPTSLMNQKNIRAYIGRQSRTHAIMISSSSSGCFWSMTTGDASFSLVSELTTDHVCGKIAHSPDSVPPFSEGLNEGCKFVSSGWLNV